MTPQPDPTRRQVPPERARLMVDCIKHLRSRHMQTTAAQHQINQFAPPVGRMPTIEYVPVAELRIDASYQRTLSTPRSQKLIKSIAAAWDWDVFDTLKVGRRPDDALYVIDGQHRLAAARARGDIAQLPCVIKRTQGAADEARLFIAANRQRKTMTRLDDHRAAGDAASVAVERLVAGAGLSIARHEMTAKLAPGELACVHALRRLLDHYGEPRLRAALAIVGAAFAREVIVNPSPLIEAVITLVDTLPAEGIATTLASGTSAQWGDWAQLKHVSGGKSRMMALRDVIHTRWRAAREGVAAGMYPAPASPADPSPGTFEAQLAAVQAGKARVVDKFVPRRADPEMTLGGVASAAL